MGRRRLPADHDGWCDTCSAKRAQYITPKVECGTCHEYRRRTGTERPAVCRGGGTSRQIELNWRAEERRIEADRYR